jgi:crotonobetainyl-CoA:carnitine CoA-transferase CaiB-like acyl-CoA transferase
MVAPAFRFPGAEMPRQPAPAYGADTETVLTELGYDSAKIAALRTQKII